MWRHGEIKDKAEICFECDLFLYFIVIPREKIQPALQL